MREIILDTETTGLDPFDGHRIIEIGAVEMVNKVLTGKKFHTYINPQRVVPQEAYRIHGISTEFLKDRPLFHEIAQQFVEFVEGGTLVIHNAVFDLKFLNHELSKASMTSLDYLGVVDTLVMARKMFPGQRANLDALCRRYRIDNSLRGYHGALKDAKLLAEVYVELCGGRQATFALSASGNKTEQKSKINASGIKVKTTTVLPAEEELLAHDALKKRIGAPA